jgi:hypothetical protein
MKVFLMALCLSYGLMASNALDEAKKLGVESDYASAILKAKKEKKMLVLVIVKENCRWCEKLVDQTLSQERVKKRLENYITVIVDKEDEYPNIFNEDFFPSIFYIDYNSEKSVYSNVGFVGEKCFLNDLNFSQESLDTLFGDKELK